MRYRQYCSLHKIELFYGSYNLYAYSKFTTSYTKVSEEQYTKSLIFKQGTLLQPVAHNIIVCASGYINCDALDEYCRRMHRQEMKYQKYFFTNIFIPIESTIRALCELRRKEKRSCRVCRLKNLVAPRTAGLYRHNRLQYSASLQKSRYGGHNIIYPVCGCGPVHDTTLLCFCTRVVQIYHICRSSMHTANRYDDSTHNVQDDSISEYENTNQEDSHVGEV